MKKRLARTSLVTGVMALVSGLAYAVFSGDILLLFVFIASSGVLIFCLVRFELLARLCHKA